MGSNLLHKNLYHKNFSDCTSPFEVSVVTDATQDGAAPTATQNGNYTASKKCLTTCLCMI